MIFNEAFWIFAISWTSGIFGAAAFATFGPLFERWIDALHQRVIRWRGERRGRSLAQDFRAVERAKRAAYKRRAG